MPDSSQIAVLVAIAIPIFNTQLERSRDAASVANLRAAYAEAAAELLGWDGTSSTTDNPTIVSISKSGKEVTVVVKNVTIETRDGNEWSKQASDVAFEIFTDPGTPQKNGNATFIYNNETGLWKCTGVSAP